MASGVVPDLGFQPSVVKGATDIYKDPEYSMDLDIALSSSMRLEVTMAPGGSAGRSDLYGPGSSMTLRYQYGHRWQPRIGHLCGCWW